VGSYYFKSIATLRNRIYEEVAPAVTASTAFQVVILQRYANPHPMCMMKTALERNGYSRRGGNRLQNVPHCGDEPLPRACGIR
jgi:hypothetical protein